MLFVGNTISKIHFCCLLREKLILKIYFDFFFYKVKFDTYNVINLFYKVNNVITH